MNELFSPAGLTLQVLCGVYCSNNVLFSHGQSTRYSPYRTDVLTKVTLSNVSKQIPVRWNFTELKELCTCEGEYQCVTLNCKNTFFSITLRSGVLGGREKHINLVDLGKSNTFYI